MFFFFRLPRTYNLPLTHGIDGLLHLVLYVVCGSATTQAHAHTNSEANPAFLSAFSPHRGRGDHSTDCLIQFEWREPRTMTLALQCLETHAELLPAFTDFCELGRGKLTLGVHLSVLATTDPTDNFLEQSS
ncbi:hypothetical protein K504DRAFT_30856 [Pleomassaria siparia CBS 279.74]|uniref:Uncharacterized protein n=1 Tax=Pleomassaria siparia CBS 279.74 TaxID=1314801 RepID=A0A6G1KT19_9PLEO|nr:hypothetical protein K504DRAFT_30856 [Pleomassaria siparia CBS 279.74]